MRKLDFSGLSETDFEEFTFHLLGRLGFINLNWRKGTALESSPADSGRDIVCQQIREDVDKTKQVETWFVDCKHYKKGIPAGDLQNLLTWSEAERPHTALIVASGFLSNPAKDYLEKYERNRRPPFRIDPEIKKGMLAAMRRAEKKYGKKKLRGGYYSDDFGWGMLNGKLSALRWVLGEDWDMLDT